MFKEGDEVFCVNDRGSTLLEVGKVYKLEKVSWRGSWLNIKDSNGITREWTSARFVPNTPEGKAEGMRRLMDDS